MKSCWDNLQIVGKSLESICDKFGITSGHFGNVVWDDFEIIDSGTALESFQDKHQLCWDNFKICCRNKFEV